VRRIQEFTRTRQTRLFQPVDVCHVVREAIELTRGRWRDEARVRGVTYTLGTDLADVPAVAGEAAELREVVTNLLLNGLDAMPDGGALDFGVRAEAGSVFLTVRDSGSGMPADVRERVFEPFFTTKGPRSTGLGLSVAYGIVQRHGGRIDVESVEGQGTTFTIRLPSSAAAPAATPAAIEPEVGGAPGPSARVLVIDDERSVRELLVDILASAGHVPLAAADGASGIALGERMGPLDLALIDLGLPGMSGWDVAARLRAGRPALPLVLITGWGDRLDPTELARSGIREVIAKPFRTDQVLRVVAEHARTAAPALPSP
jgi:CheY-like chemotaxis protein